MYIKPFPDLFVDKCKEEISFPVSPSLRMSLNAVLNVSAALLFGAFPLVRAPSSAPSTFIFSTGGLEQGERTPDPAGGTGCAHSLHSVPLMNRNNSVHPCFC